MSRSDSDGTTAREPDAAVAIVGESISTTADLLATIAEQLRFPSYFGQNWDALEECLNDLSWLPERLVVIRHEGMPAIVGDELITYLSILADTMERWRSKQGHDLRVHFPPDEWAAVEKLTRGRMRRG